MRGATGGVVGCLAALCSALLAMADAAPARGLDARVGWRAVADAAGYRLYVRTASQQYGSGIDVGNPPADGAGILRAVVPGLPLGETLYFAARAYDGSGRESGLSNEIALAPIAATPTVAPPTAPPTSPPTAPPASSPTRTATPRFTATRVPTATRTPTRTPTRRPGRSGVSGTVRFFNDGAPVPGANLVLQGLLGGASAETAADGSYALDAATLGIWQLTAEKTGDLRGAVSALDAAFILQALGGARTFGDIERQACDVTGNGTLTSVDAARILQFTVGQVARFAAAERCDSDWLFVPAPLPLPGQRLIQPLLGNSGCRAGAIVFEPLLGNAAQQDFAAVPFGDCTGNWSQQAAAGAAPLIIGRSTLRLGQPLPRPGGRWLVPIYVDDATALSALEAEIGFDPASAVLDDVELVGQPPGALFRRHAAAGRVALALASGEPVRLGQRPVAVLTFTGARAPDVWLLSGAVDGRETR